MSNSTAIVKNEEDYPLSIALNNPATVRKFERVCGQDAGSVMINIINAANTNPAIWECMPETVITAALNAAALNLSIAPGLGQACILPFNKNKKDGTGWTTEKRAQFVPMLRGVKALAMRTNKYRVLNAFCVYAGQTWVEDQRTGIGYPDGPIESKNVKIGYGAYLKLFNGFEATVYKTAEEIMAHAKKYSPTFDKQKGEFGPKSRWVTDFDEQALKTVMKDLIMNHGEISEKDRQILNTVESEEDTGPDLGELDALEGQAEAIAEPVTPAPISPEELAYLDALEVKTPMGARMGDKSQGELTAIAKRTDHPESAKAAQIILDWRKAKEERDLAQLGF
jgi:recombination protein RecT